jgi:hypothetical protein
MKGTIAAGLMALCAFAGLPAAATSDGPPPPWALSAVPHLNGCVDTSSQWLFGTLKINGVSQLPDQGSPWRRFKRSPPPPECSVA